MCKFHLSGEQIQRFKQDGFLVLRNTDFPFVDPVDLRAWSVQIQNLPKVSGKWMLYDEVNTLGKRQLMRTEYFVDFHEPFRNLLCGKDIAHVLAQLSGEDMILFKDKINYKQPHGNGFHAHLDAPAYDHVGNIEHLTANFAVDAATIANGCLEVVPGSHTMNVTFSEGGRIDSAWEHTHHWIQVPLEPGDVLLFGSHLAHRSASNNTPNARASVYATYHGVSDGQDLRTKYYAHRRLAFPPDHEREPGKDYSKGWERYGFAAPFARQASTAAAISFEN